MNSKTMKSHRIGAGLVAIDAAGHVVTPFNTIGMCRGWITPTGEMAVATHQEAHQLGTLPR